MFKNSFSFEGRIRRKEYLLSYLIIYAVVFVCGFFSELLEIQGAITGLIFLIPILWFSLAQNAKRSHDIGNSGWFQLIPFYKLWLLFVDGNVGVNKYGTNPKG